MVDRVHYNRVTASMEQAAAGVRWYEGMDRQKAADNVRVCVAERVT